MTDRLLGITSDSANFAYSSYCYDAVSRLTSLAYNLNGAAAASGWSFTYNPAGQIASVTRGNDLLAWQGHANRTTPSSVNGLNQLTAVGGAAVTHNARGNLTSDGINSYTYDAENRLLTRGGGGTASLVCCGRSSTADAASLTPINTAVRGDAAKPRRRTALVGPPAGLAPLRVGYAWTNGQTDMGKTHVVGRVRPSRPAARQFASPLATGD